MFMVKVYFTCLNFALACYINTTYVILYLIAIWAVAKLIKTREINAL